MRSNFLVYLLIVFTGPSASAQQVTNAVTCTPKDLRSQFGPVRSQQSTGWCFAMSLADLLGQRLQVRPPEMVSAREVAVTLVSFNNTDASSMTPSRGAEISGFVSNNFDGVRLNRRSGGHPIHAFQAYKSRGRLCLESQLPSQALRHNEEWLAKQVDDYYKALDLPTDPPPSRQSADEIIRCYNSSSFVEGASEVQKSMNNLAADGMRRDMDRVCPSTDRLSGLNPVQKFLSNGSSKLDLEMLGQSALDEGQGFIVDYDVNAWKKPVEISAANDGGTYSYQHDSGGRHASVVVGRRWNANSKQCELLIRNSWGSSCAPYRPGVECEEGHFWVSSKELFDRTHSVFRF